MEEIRVRVPSPSDGPQIGRVHVRAWKSAYAGLMAPELLAGLDEVERGEAWHQRLLARDRHRPEPGVEFLVAETDGGVVGIATVGTERGGTDGPGADRGELRMINVTPEAWGTGAGPTLLQAAEDRLRSLGYDSAVLWVVAGNSRARRFYEREGWVHDGARRTYEIEGHPVPECRYRRRLRPRPASRRAAHTVRPAMAPPASDPGVSP